MGSVSTTRLAALLLLLQFLGAALATVPGKPTVMEIRAGLGAHQRLSVASVSQVGPQDSDGYNDYGVQEQEVCVQEVNRRDCQIHSVNGEKCGVFASKAQDRGCDAVTSFWTSELACCHDKHDYGHGSATVGDHLWGSAHGTIGTCDWVMHYADDDVVRRIPGIPISSNIFKLGSANAICFFGVDSQECGGPLCERMVMSLDGFVYYAKQVYTYWGETDTSPNDNRLTYQCDIVDGLFGINIDRKAAAGEGAKAAQGTSSLQAAGDTEAAPAKPAAASDASTQYYSGGHYDARPVYSGEAVVINGIVSSMAGPRKDNWDSGVFEFVVAYDVGNQGKPITALEPNIPWARDKAYKFTFYKQARG